MKLLYFYCAYFASFLALTYAGGHGKSFCLEREKALALLETAEDLLSKAGDTFPSCKQDLNSTNSTDCEDEKPLAYIEVSKKLISDVRENFPECPKLIEKDDETTPKTIEEDDRVTSKTVEEDYKTTPKAIEEDDRITPNTVEENYKTTPKTIEEDDKTTVKPIEKNDTIVQNIRPTDCSDISASGRNESGVYVIFPRETNTTLKAMLVYCDMETDDGPWTVIQRRGKFPVQQDFYLDWGSYKRGFGNLTEEFWLGNENIRVLCLNGCEIRFDLQDVKGEKGFALYQNFRLLGSNYTLDISGYSGNAGDSMQLHNGFDFSTKDHGITEKATDLKSGWWHRESGYDSNLNGLYKTHIPPKETVFWYSWRYYVGLAKTEMKVRAKKM